MAKENIHRAMGSLAYAIAVADGTTQKIGLNDAYAYAMDILEANRHDYDFDDATKKQCVTFMKKIADSFGETNYKEINVLERFESDISRF